VTVGFTTTSEVPEAPPRLTANLASRTIGYGGSVSFSVQASGSPRLHYQWYQGPVDNIATPVGSDTPTYTTPGLTASTSYWVRVSNYVGEEASSATVTVLDPTITIEPADQTISLGSFFDVARATLTIEANGSGPIVYQWYQGQSGDISHPLPGEISAALSATPLTGPVELFWSRVTSAVGSRDSRTATILVDRPPWPDAPRLIEQPASRDLANGSAATLEVTAVGSGPLTYVWYGGVSGELGSPEGSNATSFTTPVLAATTSYWMCVTDVYGQATDSQTAVITVIPAVLRVGSARGCHGTEVLVPVRGRGLSGIGSIQWTLLWDPAVATFVAIEQFGLPELTEENFAVDAVAGTLTLVWEDASLAGAPVPADTVLFALRLRLTGARGANGALLVDSSLTPAEVTDADGMPLPVALQPGQVEIVGQLILSGAVTYFEGARPVAGVTLSLTGAATQEATSGGDGGFAMLVGGCAEYVLTPKGADDDPLRAGVTAADIALLRQHVLHSQLLTSPYALLAADVNGSGTATAADIRMIRQFILATRDTFPLGLWRFVRSSYTFSDPSAPWSAEGFSQYTGLETDVDGEGFLAIKLGDVNGSWGTTTGLIRLAQKGQRESRRVAPEDPVGLAVSSLAAAPGALVRVPVKGRGVTQMTSAQFTLGWDPAVLRFVWISDYGLRGLDDENFGTRYTAEGKLAVAWDDPELLGVTVANSEPLFSVEFAVIGSAGTGTIVAVSDDPTPREVTLGMEEAAVHATDGLLVADGTGTVPSVSATACDGGQLSLSFTLAAGLRWVLETSDDLLVWTQLSGPGEPAGTAKPVTVTVPTRLQRQGFFRFVFLP